MVITDEEMWLFKGKETVSFVWLKRVGDEVFYKKPNKFLHFLSKWQPLMGNVKSYLDKHYTRSLYKPHIGRTDEVIRVMPFDLDTMQPHSVDINQEVVNEVEDLRVENDFMHRLVREMESLILTSGNLDLLKQRVHDDYEFYVNKLKPQFFPGKKEDKKK